MRVDRSSVPALGAVEIHPGEHGLKLRGCETSRGEHVFHRFDLSAKVIKVDERVERARGVGVGKGNDMLGGEVFDEEQNVAEATRHKTYPDEVVDGLSHVSGFLKKFQNDRLAGFSAFPLDAFKLHRRRSVAKPGLTEVVDMKVLLHGTHDLLASLLQMLGALGLVGMQDRVHYAKHDAGPGAAQFIGGVGASHPKQELPRVLAVLNLGRRAHSGRVLFGHQHGLEEVQRLDDDRVQSAAVAIVLKIVAIALNKSRGVLGGVDAQTLQVKRGTTTDKDFHDGPFELPLGEQLGRFVVS
jgi:hypothetical protein